jgi:hypothetical protein
LFKFYFFRRAGLIRVPRLFFRRARRFDSLSGFSERFAYLHDDALTRKAPAADSTF